MKRLRGLFDKTILKNIIGAFLVKGGSVILSLLLLLPAYIRYFNNETVLGIWYTLLSIINWVLWFDLGMGQGLRNQLPRELENGNWTRIRQYISTTYVSMILLAVLIEAVGAILICRLDWVGILNVSADVIDSDVLRKCVLIVFTGFMLQMVLKIITFILYALQRSAIVNLLGLASNIFIFLAISVMPSADINTNLLRMSVINVAAINLPLAAVTIVVFAKTLRNAIPSIRYFNRSMVREVVNVGMVLIWLQLAFMVVSAMNEFVITRLVGPAAVVEYKIYQKIFNTATVVVSLALTPIWSAVTKAQAQKNYAWIKSIYLVFCGCTAICFLGELLLIPPLQWGVNVLLGEGALAVNKAYALVFVCYSTVFVLHNVNTSIGNGMSYFRVQQIWMTFAAVAYIPVAMMLVRLFDSWIWVVIANIIVMLPYEITAVFCTISYLNKKITQKNAADEKSVVLDAE